MAKVYYPEHIDHIQGKVCKKDPNGLTYMKRRDSGTLFVQHRHNYKYNPTANQTAINDRFAAAQAAVKTVRQNPSELKAYQDAFKENPGKYSTLQGYMFAAEFAKLA